jgi:NhaP-type Na+/H+ or K+/H+ antiporter
VFGALISPTNPVSVLDVPKRVGGSRRLQATGAWESLISDGLRVRPESFLWITNLS